MSDYGDGLERMLKILNRIHPMSKDLEKLVSPTMFEQPNTTGFILLSQYLLSTYDQERFEQAVQWPLLNKTEEGRYRAQVKSFIGTVFEENDDFTMSSIQSSHLHTARGEHFINLMVDLTLIVLRKVCERQTGKKGLRYPKQWDPLTETLFTNITAKMQQDAIDKTENYEDIEKRAVERMKETSERITNYNENIFKLKPELAEVVAKSDVDEDLKKRLVDIKDKEAIKEMAQDVYAKIEELRKKVEEQDELMKYSEEINNLVKSVCGQDRVILDGSKLPKVDLDKLSKYPLNPEARVLVQKLYNEDGLLVLRNWLVVFKAVLNCSRNNLTQEEFTPEDNEVIKEQTEVLKEMSEELSQIQIRMKELADKLPKEQLQPRAPDDGKILNLSLELENLGLMTEKRLLLTPNTSLPALFLKTDVSSPLAGPSTTIVKDMQIPKLKFDDSIDLGATEKKSLPPNLMRLFTGSKSDLISTQSTSELVRNYTLNLSSSFCSLGKKSSLRRVLSSNGSLLDQDEAKEEKNFDSSDEIKSMADILRKYKADGDTSKLSS
ncbi:augmin complex subunit dgt6 [Cotesia glomerata]|nr:augmin complex subunit dgt6 [Cotesia glomerata]